MRQDLVDWITLVSKTRSLEWIIASLKKTGYIDHQYISELKEVYGIQTITNYLENLEPKLNLPKEYPDLKLNGSNYVAIEGRVCRVLFESKLPRIFMVDNFLSDEECNLLISLSEPTIKRSMVISRKEDKSELHDARTSSGTHLSALDHPFLKEFDDRVASLVNWPSSKQETTQILKYMPGEEYKPHNDYFDPNSASTENILLRGGQRLASMIIYLNNCAEGGGTIFPESGIEVKPKKGCAVFFSYPSTNSESKTLHGGSPVIQGEKWIAVKWFRESNFV